MRGRARAAFLTVTGLMIIAPASAAAATTVGSSPARPAATGQPTTWTIVASPNRTAAGRHHFDPLYSISCASADDCTTVGNSNWHRYVRTLIESWNGTAWSIVPSPNRDAHDVLYGVSCASVSACMAVGWYTHGTDSSQAKTLTESWNGTAWSIRPSPSPDPSLHYAHLAGVSCVSASDCTAVGYYTAADGELVPLAETWNGTTWSVTWTPRKGAHSQLDAVSCPASGACTAVGTYTPAKKNSTAKTLAESWNGSKWSVVPSPNPSAGGYLDGVSCMAADSCTAVGSGRDGADGQQTLAETWNGTAWTIVPSPNAGGTDAVDTLSGVSCPAAGNCTAVGNYYNYSTHTAMATLVEGWNGSTWSVISSPNEGKEASLTGVSCASPATCMADGSWGYHERTLTELGT
jgi:hypothetical protein